MSAELSPGPPPAFLPYYTTHCIASYHANMLENTRISQMVPRGQNLQGAVLGPDCLGPLCSHLCLTAKVLGGG